MSRMGLGLAVALLALIFPALAEAQSFNCRLARTPDEILICQDVDLSKLDEQMSSIFFTRRNRATPAVRAALDADQADWLVSRRACGRDYRCVRAAYVVRMDELSR